MHHELTVYVYIGAVCRQLDESLHGRGEDRGDGRTGVTGAGGGHRGHRHLLHGHPGHLLPVGHRSVFSSTDKKELHFVNSNE